MSYIMQAEPSVTRTVTAVRSTTLVLCKERAVVNICHTAMHLVAVDNHLVPRVLGGLRVRRRQALSKCLKAVMFVVY